MERTTTQPLNFITFITLLVITSLWIPQLVSAQPLIVLQPEMTLSGLGSVNDAAFSHDGTRVAVASNLGAIVWSIADRTPFPMQWLSGHSAEVNSVAFSPDDLFLVSGSKDSTAIVWDLTTEKIEVTFLGHSDNIWSVAYSHDGASIVSASWDSTAIIWSAADGSELTRLSGHGSWVWEAAFSHDDSMVISTGSDEKAILWNTEGGSIINVYTGHTGWIRSAAFSHDDYLVVTGGADHSIKSWDTLAADEDETLQAYQVYNIHQGRVLSLDISPDGLYLLSGSEDNSAKLTDLDTGEVIRIFSGHTDRIQSVQFSEDGMRVLSASDDGTVRIWDISDLYPDEPEQVVLGGGAFGGEPGDQLYLPIMIRNLPSTKTITFEVTFNPEILDYSGLLVVDSTMLSHWALVDANLIFPGRIRIIAVALANSPAEGSGRLLILPLTIRPDAIAEFITDLKFINTSDGLASAESKPIRIAVGKKGDVDSSGDISAADVQMAFDVSLQRIVITEYHLWAADINEDLRVTASDVQTIFEVALGREELPAFIPAKRLKQFSQNRDTTPPQLQVGSVNVVPDSEIQIPVFLTSSNPVSSLWMELFYDPSILTFTAINTEDTLSNSLGILGANEINPGRIRISATALSSPPIQEEGVLFNLQFHVNGTANRNTEIHILSTDDDLANTETLNGFVQIKLSSDWRIFEP